jgi:hypothetical protein
VPAVVGRILPAGGGPVSGRSTGAGGSILTRRSSDMAA